MIKFSAIQANSIAPNFCGKSRHDRSERCNHYREYSDMLDMIPQYRDLIDYPAIKYEKKIFNYAPKDYPVSDIEKYRGPKAPDAGFSTEGNGLGGGWLIADCDTPLSTADVHTCAVVNLVNEKTNENLLYHVFHVTDEVKMEKYIKDNFPEFDKVNIVGGDQMATVKTMKKILNAVNQINPQAEIEFFRTVTPNPEIVAYKGGIYYIDNAAKANKMDSEGTVSFNEVVLEQKDMWY